MPDQTDLDALGNAVLALLHTHQLAVDGFTVEVTVPAKEFDRTANNHPDQLRPGVLRRSLPGRDLQWSIVVRRHEDIELPQPIPVSSAGQSGKVDRLSLEALSNDLWALFQSYHLVVSDFMVCLTIPGREFDVLAVGHPNRIHPRVLQYSASSGGVERFVQITRRRELEEFPPGVILSPPE